MSHGCEVFNSECGPIGQKVYFQMIPGVFDWIEFGSVDGSVSPLRLAKREPIQSLPARLLVGHPLVHQRHEAGVVSGLQYMNLLMDQDIFEALARLLCKVRVRPDAVCSRIPASPFRFRPLKKEMFHLHAYYGSHFAINSGTVALTCSVYQRSTMDCLAS